MIAYSWQSKCIYQTMARAGSTESLTAYDLNLRGVVTLGNDRFSTSLDWCCTSISFYYSHATVSIAIVFNKYVMAADEDSNT